ncbi:hypothetical protein ACFQX6_64120 [Streptosporangium lutulentum]
MAIPKKGSRLISVDGTAYRWRIRHKPTYCQGNGWGSLTYAVEPAGRRGRVLLVELPCSRSDAWLGERTMTVRQLSWRRPYGEPLTAAGIPHRQGVPSLSISPRVI